MWVPTQALGLDLDRHRGPAGLGPKGGDESLVGQQRRVDPSGQVPEVLQGLSHLRLHLLQHGRRSCWIFGAGGPGQANLHRKSHQLLLGPVVDVALQAPPFGVLGRHYPLTRGLQLLQAVKELLGQADVAKDQAGTGGQVLGQVLLGGGEPLSSLLHQRQGSQELPPVLHGQGQGGG